MDIAITHNTIHDDILEQPSAVDSHHLSDSAIAALAQANAGSNEQQRSAEHLIGGPGQKPCPECRRRLAEAFLSIADGERPEVAAALAAREGSLDNSGDLLRLLLKAEPASAQTLKTWEQWTEGRRGPCDAAAVPPVILASYEYRFDAGNPELIALARLAVSMAEAAGDPLSKTFARAWLARVRGIRGELREASREIEIALRGVEQLVGDDLVAGRAYTMYQAADLRLRLRDFGHARDRFERASELYRRLDVRMAHWAELSLGIVFSESGRYEEARQSMTRILAESRHALLVKAALQSLAGEVFPHLAMEGETGLAETALCLTVVEDAPLPSAPGLLARAIWRNGRMAWALGAPRLALGRYAEARAVFLGASTDTAGLFEAASLSLDMLEILLRLGDRRRLQAFALEAATTFNALGVDPACLLALGYVRQLEIRDGAGVYVLAHARLSLELAEKRRLLKSVGEGGVI
jgi:tetratricopeptide (TPR) repeat protein